MADAAHAETDKRILAMQKRLNSVYREAQKDVSAEMLKYAETVKAKADKLLDAVNNATDEKAKQAAKGAYFAFFAVELRRDKRFKQMTKAVAETLYGANMASAERINAGTADIYTINYNQIGRGLERDLDGYRFQPVSEDEVAKYGEVTQQTVDKRKDTAWNEQNVRNAVIAGAALYLAADKIFNNAAKKTVQKNRDSAHRQASDMFTDAETKGRLDGMYRASDEGHAVKKIWKATNDNRTRDSHREYGSMPSMPLDYEYNTGLKKPKDDDCPFPAEVYNCRCTLLTDVGQERSKTMAAREGEVTGSYFKSSSFKDTETVIVPNMTYKEWMKWRSR